jgi:alpha-tubulin suppressor-like RCC1 family protein
MCGMQQIVVLSLLAIATVTASTCSPGFSGDQCQSCALGSFAALSNSDTCRQCPMDMTTVTTGSTSLADCVCNAGLTKDLYGFCVDCASSGDPSNTCACVETDDFSCGSTVFAAAGATCILFHDVGKIKCWGRNDYGELGTLSVPLHTSLTQPPANYVDFGDNGRVVGLNTESYNTCVVFESGTVKCWGLGFSGLGLESLDSQQGADYLTSTASTTLSQFGVNRKAKKIVSAMWAKCVLFEDRTVKCFGEATYGQLGYGDELTRGGSAGTMGDNLPEVDFGTERHVLDIWGSNSDSYGPFCVLLNTAEIKCWGRCMNYQCGWETIPTSQKVGNLPGDMGDNLQAANIPTGRTVISLVSSRHQMVALLDDRSIICWGGTSYGRCASGSTTSLTRIQDAGRMQLRPGDVATQISTGSWATYVLTTTGKIAVAGNNNDGSVGTGVLGSYGDDPSEVGANLLYVDLGTNVIVKGLAASGSVGSCVVTSTYTLKCWGNGYYGQLGIGNTETIGDEPGEMGDALVSVDLGSTPIPPCLGAGEQPQCSGSCGAGLISNIDDGCVPCEENTYCTNAVMTNCPPDTRSSAGSISEADCKCISGYFRAV